MKLPFSRWKHPRAARALAVVAVVALGSVGAIAVAAPAQAVSQPGCYNASTGVLRTVTSTALCKATTEIAVKWVTNTGATGARGATGATGAKGATGATGAKGATGATGAKGATGATGAKGATGSAAWSSVTPWRSTTAYTAGPPSSVVAHGGGVYVAVAGSTAVTPGSDGTKWVQIAAPGAAGPQGIAGPRGLQGIQGATGAVGAAGADGATGAAGATGATGATGPQGPKGDTGDTGATGPQGPAGPAGPAGEAASAVDPAQGFPEGCTAEASPLVTFTFAGGTTAAVDGVGFCVMSTASASYTNSSIPNVSAVTWSDAYLNLDPSGIATRLSNAKFTGSKITGMRVQLGESAAGATCDAAAAQPSGCARATGSLVYTFGNLGIDALNLPMSGSGSAFVALPWETLSVTAQGRSTVLVSATADLLAGNNAPLADGRCATPKGSVQVATIDGAQGPSATLREAFDLSAPVCLDLEAAAAARTSIRPLRLDIANSGLAALVGIVDGRERKLTIATYDASKRVVGSVVLTGLFTSTTTGKGSAGSSAALEFTVGTIAETFSAFAADGTKTTTTFGWSVADNKAR
ncbi:hypothetical protein HD599_001190 [Conyzicola lurida]|uniref:Collagen triple helix repeat protein n=1 Tax=Conyzicola lurida TaxID=1172621 RepID=A0A841AI06_9MICO|nr:collagen-like protein [Conyzicola lurida]MBB5842867.1 hypothetical protein [Conyzicola lurida]